MFLVGAEPAVLLWSKSFDGMEGSRLRLGFRVYSGTLETWTVVAIRRRVIMVKLYRIVVYSRRSVHPSRSLSEVCAMQSVGITRRERIPEDSGPEPCGEKATAPAISFYRSRSAAHCVSWNLTSSSAKVDFTNLPMPTRPHPKPSGL